MYKVIISSFLNEGGDGFSMMIVSNNFTKKKRALKFNEIFTFF